MNAPKLHPGDTVAIISPSNTVADKQEQVATARRKFEAATGLKTVLAPNALAQHFYSAGTAQQRLDDFHWALKNPDAKGIIFSVGGDTAVELVDRLDYDLVRQHPKIIAGISDAATLLNPITAKTGLITFLGLEFLDFAREPMPYEVASIKKAWFEGSLNELAPNPDWRDFDDLPTSYPGTWQVIQPGQAEGRIVGGNGSSFAQLLGTAYAPDFRASILVIETYHYAKKKIHRILTQLKLAGVLGQISGLVIGYCIGSDDPHATGNDRPMADVVLEATAGYDFPILQIGEIGHNVENPMLPIGARARLDATTETFTILEPVTA